MFTTFRSVIRACCLAILVAAIRRELAIDAKTLVHFLDHNTSNATGEEPFKHHRSSKVAFPKIIDQQKFWGLDPTTLKVKSSWQALTAGCTKTVGTQKLRLQRFVARGEQARVFSLGIDQAQEMHAVKLFLNEAEAIVEFQALEQLGKGAAGKSPYIMHLAPGVKKGKKWFLKTQYCCGIPCVVVDFIHGKPLQSLQRYYRGYYNADGEEVLGVPLQLQFVISVVCQVMRGLVALEKSGVENCDQSSRNIMVSDDGHVKLIDFGKAKTASSWEANCFALREVFSPFKVVLAGLDEGGDKEQIRHLVEQALTYETAQEALNFLMQEAFSEQDCLPVPLS